MFLLLVLVLVLILNKAILNSSLVKIPVFASYDMHSYKILTSVTHQKLN